MRMAIAALCLAGIFGFGAISGVQAAEKTSPDGEKEITNHWRHGGGHRRGGGNWGRGAGYRGGYYCR